MSEKTFGPHMMVANVQMSPRENSWLSVFKPLSLFSNKLKVAQKAGETWSNIV